MQDGKRAPLVQGSLLPVHSHIRTGICTVGTIDWPFDGPQDFWREFLNLPCVNSNHKSLFSSTGYISIKSQLCKKVWPHHTYKYLHNIQSR